MKTMAMVAKMIKQTKKKKMSSVKAYAVLDVHSSIYHGSISLAI